MSDNTDWTLIVMASAKAQAAAEAAQVRHTLSLRRDVGFDT